MGVTVGHRRFILTVLTADVELPSRGSPGIGLALSVGVDIIYKGALVNVNAAGFLIAAGDTASETCVGIADENVDNSGGSAGDLVCKVLSGRAFLITATSLLQTDVGTLAMVVDDDTVEVAAATSNDVEIGYIIEFVSVTSVWVYIPEGGYNAG